MKILSNRHLYTFTSFIVFMLLTTLAAFNPKPIYASSFGCVFLDGNENGIMEPTGQITCPYNTPDVEPGINGITLTSWTDMNGNGVFEDPPDFFGGTTTTFTGGTSGPFGYFQFGAPSGSISTPYYIAITVPPGYHATTPTTIDARINSGYEHFGITGDNPPTPTPAPPAPTPTPTPTPTPPPGSFSLTNIFTGCLAANAPSVDIYWSTSSNVDHYLVYRWNNGTNQYDEIGNAGTSTSFRDINASQGTTAVYTVVAFNDNGATGPSNSPNNISTTVASCPPASVDLKCNGVDGTASIDNNTSATLSWTTGGSPSSCNASNAWSGAKSTTGGSEATANLTGPNTFTYALSCSNYYSSASDSCAVSVSPPSSNPPVINSLKVTNGGNTSFGGTLFSGNQSSQGGSDWYNPISITLNATQGSASITEYYVNFSPGFSLSYVNGTPFVNGINISNYPGGYPVNENGSLSYTVFSLGTGSWRIRFEKNFGSRNMSTTGYVKDSNGLCSNSINNSSGNNNCSAGDLNPSQ